MGEWLHQCSWEQPCFVKVDLQAGCFRELVEQVFDAADIVSGCFEDDQRVIGVPEHWTWSIIRGWVLDATIHLDHLLEDISHQEE